jgi:hypothetical protein
MSPPDYVHRESPSVLVSHYCYLLHHIKPKLHTTKNLSYSALYCVYIPHFLNLFRSFWAPRLIPHLGYCDCCCSQHGHAGVYLVC